MFLVVTFHIRFRAICCIVILICLLSNFNLRCVFSAVVKPVRGFHDKISPPPQDKSIIG